MSGVAPSSRRQVTTRARCIRRTAAAALLRACVPCAAAILAWTAAAAGDEAVPVKRIFVRADQPESWPEGFHPIGIDEYRRFVDATAERVREPKTAWIEHAEYSAVLIGDQLSRAEMTATVRGGDAGTQLLILDPLNLVLTDLSWGEKPSSENTAIWGTAPDGQLALLVDGDDGPLSGNWYAPGRPFGSDIEFDIHVAPAAVSVLHLQIPADHRLTCSAGDVSGPEPIQDEGWNRWQVLLGNKTGCRLTIHRPKVQGERPSLVVVDQEQSYIVRDEGVALQTKFLNLEIHGTPLDALEFHLPADVEVDKLTYGGDAELDWKSEKSGGYQRVVTRFPVPLEGRARTIRLLGFAPTRLGEVWRVPEISLRDASTLSLRTNIKIEEPLEIHSLNHAGYRQVDADADSLTFERHHANARLTLEVDRPRPQPSAQIATQLFADVDECSMESTITWQTRAGRMFEVRCGLSPQWEITEVRLHTEGGSSLVTSWDVHTGADGKRLFLLQLPKVLTPQSPQSVQIYATRLSAFLGQRLELPAFTPLGCSTVEQVVVLAHPKSHSAVPEQPTSFELLAEGDIPEYYRKDVAAGLLRQIPPSMDTLTLHSVEPDAAGLIALRSNEPPFEALAETVVEIDSDRVVETTELTVRPKGTGIDRLHVYLTTRAALPQWQAGGDNGPALEAELLSAERHSEWKLPANDGELWELRFPEPQRSAFRIIASRTSASAYSHEPALVFVPDAQPFSGMVTLRAPPDMKLNVEASGLRAVDMNPSEAGPNQADAEGPRGPTPHERRRTWSYDSLGGILVLRSLDVPLSESSRSPVALTLSSLIEKGGRGDDIHWATYRIAADPRPRPFRFSLPKPAELVDIRLNNQTVRQSASDSEHVLPVLPEGRSNIVEIQYRCPTVRRFGREARPVILPRCSLPVLDMSWQIALPPELRLASAPPSMSLSGPLRDSRWTERLFGPLGRMTGSTLFNPFSENTWQRYFGGDEPPKAAEPAWRLGTPPPGRVIYHVRAPRLPESATLLLWDNLQTRLLAWTVFFGCLLAGLTMKLARFSRRRAVAVTVLCGVPIVCMTASPVLAEIMGASIAATLICVLLPRSVLQPAGRPGEAVEGNSVTTTIHLPSVSSFSMLLFAIAVIRVAGAEESPTPADTAQSVPPRRHQSSAEELPVLIPVDEKMRPLPSTPVVYVTDEFIKRLNALDAVRSQAYLITSANYEVQIGGRDSATLEARYSIVVLSKTGSTAVELPITNAELILPHACLVNGVPQEVLSGSDGGFIVELAQSAGASEQDENGAAGDTPSAPSDSADSEPAAVDTPAAEQQTVPRFDVVLRMHPRLESLPGGGSLEIGIPRVTASQLRVVFADDYPVVDVLGEAGKLALIRAEDGLTAPLGLTDRFMVNWSTSDDSVRAQLEAGVQRFVEVHPARLEYRYRVAYRVLRGSVDFLEWDVPAQTIVRRVAGNYRYHITRRSGQSDSDRLRIELESPHSDEILVDASLTLPLDSVNGDVVVPLPALHGNDAQWADVRTTMNHAGLGTTNGYQLTPTEPELRPLANSAAGSIMRQDASGAKLAEPAFVYQLQNSEALRFQLKPRSSRRRVLQSQEIHVRRNRLDWRITADVTIGGAAVFQHVLRIDPRLQIESISVNQGGAERLAHWSRERENLTLFLSGPGKDVQDVVITGSLKLQTPSDTPLPFVAFDDADIDDSQVVLYRDPEVSVALVDMDGLSRVDSTGSDRADEGLGAFVGHYRLQPAQPFPRIRIARSNVAVPADLAVLVQNDPDPGTWSIVTALRFRDLTTAPPFFRFKLPAECSESYELEAAAEQETVRLPDGSLQITLKPTAEVTRGFSVKIRSVVQPPASYEWRLPLPAIEDITPAESYLLLDVDGMWTLRDQTAEALPADTLPAWIVELVGQERAQRPLRTYRTNDQLDPVLQNQSRAQAATAAVPLVATRLWIGKTGETLGSTQIVVVPQSSASLTVGWPSGTAIRGLFVDGDPAEPEQEPTHELTVALQPGTQPRRVLVYWSRESRQNVPRLGILTQECPHLKGVSADRSLLTVIPPAGSWFLAHQGVVGIDAAEHATIRLEGLLDAVQHDSRSDISRTWVWRSLLEWDEWLARHWHLEKAAGETQRDEPGLWSRFESLHAEVQSLERRSQMSGAEPNDDRLPPPAASPFGARMLDFPHAESKTIVYGGLVGDGQNFRIGFLCFDSLLLTWVLIIGGVVLAVPIGRKLNRIDLDAWLGDREPFAWMLLGLVWWMCLRPSWFGLVLLIVAVWQAVTNRRRPENADDFELGPT